MSSRDLSNSFLIVDASGLIHRSFYAIRGLSSPTGEPTGALFGFIRSLIKAVKDLEPTSIAIVFDGPNSNASRLQAYSEYKAQRKPMASELRCQIQEAKHFCTLAGLKILDVPDVEADDTIASLVRLHKGDMPTIVILSADKDLMQLVQDHVFIMNPLQDYAIFDEHRVFEVWHIMPAQIKDFLAIVGDSSDNVPGITGLGEKAALKLLQEWHSLGNIYTNIDHIEPRIRSKLEAGKKMGELSLRLITLDETVDKVPQDGMWYKRLDCLTNPERSQELIAFYREKGFSSLIPTMKDSSPPLPVSIVDTDETLEAFCRWLAQQGGPIVIDTETTSLDEHSAELVGIGLSSSYEEVCKNTLPVLIEQEKVILQKADTTICDAAVAVATAKEQIAGDVDRSRSKPAMHSCTLPNPIFYIDFAHSTLDPHHVVSELSKMALPIIGHNCKYDLHVLSRYGFTTPKIYSDTLIASWLLDPEEKSHSLDKLSLKILEKQKIPIESLLGKKPQKSMRVVPQADISQYCAEDVECTLRLHEHFTTRFQEFPKLKSMFQDVEMPLLPILFQMEKQGIFIDREKLVSLKAKVQALLEEAKKEVFELAGETFNINSPKQLSHILYDVLQLPPVKRGKTSFSTDAETLETLSRTFPIAHSLLEYRQLEKLRSTYIEALPNFIRPDTGRVHCHFVQFGTATGRLSCQDPNLQNIPVRSDLGKAIRAAFRPQEVGWSFVSFDYSQIELRILAHMSQDPVLVDAFHKNVDIHTATAKEIFHVDIEQVTAEMRQRAKAVNFGVIYGQKGFGLSRELGISVKEANEFIASYFRRYPCVEETIEALKEKARDRGYAETHTGRIRPLPEINSPNQAIRSAQERLAVNTPFQGTAADIIKMAMIEVCSQIQKRELSARMLLQIHDELLFEVPDEELSTTIPIVQQAMERVGDLTVPMKVDSAIGKNWKECYP